MDFTGSCTLRIEVGETSFMGLGNGRTKKTKTVKRLGSDFR